VIGSTGAFTVIILERIQPVGSVYVMFAVPSAIALRMPLVAPLVAIVATVVLSLVHTPPGLALLSVVVRPGHTLPEPEIRFGNAFTVTTVLRLQLLPVVYVIVVVPAATPVTTPVLLTVATLLALLHVPPPVRLSSWVVLPAHTVAVPVITSGSSFTTSDVVV
jgi:hypothetical protein